MLEEQPLGRVEYRLPGLLGLLSPDVERWTDDTAYSCRRSAAEARGEDPGEWVPLWKRRPDLDAATRAIVAEIIAELDDDDHDHPSGDEDRFGARAEVAV